MMEIYVSKEALMETYREFIRNKEHLDGNFLSNLKHRLNTLPEYIFDEDKKEFIVNDNELDKLFE